VQQATQVCQVFRVQLAPQVVLGPAAHLDLQEALELRAYLVKLDLQDYQDLQDQQEQLEIQAM